MSSSTTTPTTWNKSNEPSKTIKNEQIHDDHHSELSNSSHTTSSSSSSSSPPHPSRTAQVNHSQPTSMMDSVYSEVATMRNLNLLAANQEHGKNSYVEQDIDMSLIELETGQYLRTDLPSYTDPIVYYNDNLVDPLQSNYSHLQQGKHFLL